MVNVRCDGCPNRTFSSREELIQHRRQDHGMLTCDLCDKFYGRVSHLWKHVNKMHRGHPSVTCSTCGKISASKSHLRSHMLKMHRPGVLIGHIDSSEMSSGKPLMLDSKSKVIVNSFNVRLPFAFFASHVL